MISTYNVDVMYDADITKESVKLHVLILKTSILSPFRTQLQHKTHFNNIFISKWKFNSLWIVHFLEIWYV